MALKAFIDDSRSTGGTFVLAGCVGSIESWAKFSVEWQELLPFAPIAADLQRNFKFSEILLAGDERVQYLPAFGKVVSAFALCTIVFIMNSDDLERAQNRIQVPGMTLNWGDYGNPYLFAFVSLMEIFHNNREQLKAVIDPDEQLDFVFDNQSEAKRIRDTWDGFIEAQAPGSAKEQLGEAPPDFLNDKKFLPLQAADFVAGWARYCVERDISPAKKAVTIGSVEVENPFMPMILFKMSEDHMAAFLLAMVQRNIPPDKYALDIKSGISKAL
jgi:Protein of unknown function (DUF3800)